MVQSQDNNKSESKDLNPKPISDVSSPIIVSNDGLWGDEEDSSYEDPSTVLDSKYNDYIHEIDDNLEHNSSYNKENEDLYNIHSILTQRYNQEIQRMYNLRSQAVFILTALGFLITLAVTVAGSDWFSISDYGLPLLLILGIYLIPTGGFAFYAGKSALNIIIHIDKPEYCLDYPGQDLLDLSFDSSSKIQLNLRDQIRTLAFAINHNYMNNQNSRIKLKKALKYLIVSLMYGIIILIVVLVIGLFISPDTTSIYVENAVIYPGNII